MKMNEIERMREEEEIAFSVIGKLRLLPHT
jgi:hypothetical protein